MPVKPLSLRIDAATLEELVARGRRSGEPVSNLARRYIEEGMRLEGHPGIVFRDGPAGRRPALAHGPDVWEVARVVRGVQDRGGRVIEESAELTGCTMHEIRAVVRYYDDHREEIDDWIRQVDQEAEQAETAWLSEQARLAR